MVFRTCLLIPLFTPILRIVTGTDDLGLIQEPCFLPHCRQAEPCLVVKSCAVQDRKQEMHELIRDAAPEELGHMLEALQDAGKMGRARPLLLQTARSR